MFTLNPLQSFIPTSLTLRPRHTNRPICHDQFLDLHRHIVCRLFTDLVHKQPSYHRDLHHLTLSINLTCMVIYKQPNSPNFILRKDRSINFPATSFIILTKTSTFETKLILIIPVLSDIAASPKSIIEDSVFESHTIEECLVSVQMPITTAYMRPHSLWGFRIFFFLIIFITLRQDVMLNWRLTHKISQQFVEFKLFPLNFFIINFELSFADYRYYRHGKHEFNRFPVVFSQEFYPTLSISRSRVLGFLIWGFFGFR